MSSLLNLYLRLSFRRLLREKTYIVVTVAGLAIALVCAITLYTYAQYQLTYDEHYSKHDRIVRLAYNRQTSDGSGLYAQTSFALGPLLTRRYPQIGEYVRVYLRGRSFFRYEDTAFYWDDVYIATENYFRVFDHQSIYGELEDALADPYSLVVSESFAKRYFGDTNPVGETLSNDTGDFKVTAVFKDIPGNSHIRFSALTSFNLSRQVNGDIVDNPPPEYLFGLGGHTFLLLNPGTDIAYLQQLLDQFYEEVMKDIGEQTGQSLSFVVQSLTSIHFSTGFEGDLPTTNIFTVYALLVIAAGTLAMASINYINLAIARSSRQSRSLFVLGVLGGRRIALSGLIVFEAVIVCIVALAISWALLESLQTLVPAAVGIESPLSSNISTSPNGWLSLIAAVCVLVFVMSLPVILWQNRATAGRPDSGVQNRTATRQNFKQVLVGIQLFAAIAVTTVTLLMTAQLWFMSSQPLGFEPNNRIAVSIQSADTIEQIPLIKRELLKHGQVKGVTSSFFVPGGLVQTTIDEVEMASGAMEKQEVKQIVGDRDFPGVMGLNFVRGDDFGSPSAGVVAAAIVNERYVDMMGWKDPIGKRLRLAEFGDASVVGVVGDFHYWSMHFPIHPLRIVAFPDDEFADASTVTRSYANRYLIVALDRQANGEIIDFIRSVMMRFDSEHPFEVTDLESLVAGFYGNEVTQARLAGLFALVCIAIAGMGIFSFTAFLTQVRIKEAGIRKVLGASIRRIVSLFLGPLVVSILLAALCAGLVSYVVIDYWLTEFAYRMDLPWWGFIAPPLLVALISLITVAVLFVKAARANPVRALRFE